MCVLDSEVGLVVRGGSPALIAVVLRLRQSALRRHHRPQNLWLILLMP